MSKMYVVIQTEHDRVAEERMSVTYLRTFMAAAFSLREQAQKWLEENFSHFVNTNPDFVDLSIVEMDINENVSGPKEGINKNVYAWVSKDEDVVDILSFSCLYWGEQCCCDKYRKGYFIYTKVPKTINSRSSLVKFLKNKVKKMEEEVN